MIPFHAIFPDLAQREARYVQIGPSTQVDPAQTLPADQYVYLEHYCEDLDCDCRRVFLQVIAKNQPGKIFASINYGWEKEAFYRKSIPWDPSAPAQIIRGELDPISQQSEFANEFLGLFQRIVCDEVYRLRLRRHYRQFREELTRRNGAANVGPEGA